MAACGSVHAHHVRETAWRNVGPSQSCRRDYIGWHHAWRSMAAKAPMRTAGRQWAHGRSKCTLVVAAAAHDLPRPLVTGTRSMRDAASNVWQHDVLLVDACNVLAFARSSANTLHAYVRGAAEAGPVASFEAWITALQRMTGATQVYVVFDAPGQPLPQLPASGPGTSSVRDRRQALPNYKVARTRKRHKDATPITTVSLDHQGTGAALPRPISPEGRYGAYMRASERLGCCVMCSPPGREADDVLMALTQWLVGQDSDQKAAMGTTGSTSRRLSVAVASSDSDMQQLLAVGPEVGWLELLQLPGQPMNSGQASQAGSHLEPSHQPHPTSQANDATGQTAAVYGVGGKAPASGGAEAVSAPGLVSMPSSDHVAAMHTSALGGSMAWLPVRMHHAWQGVATPLSRVSVDQVADYSALVGKKEAGVTGAGLSSRAAVSLLHRFGSVQGVVDAVRRGVLDQRLQPTNRPPSQAPPPASASRTSPVRNRMVPVGPGGASQPPAAATSAPAQGGPLVADVVGIPPGLQRALGNLAITRLGCDPRDLPMQAIQHYYWQRVGAAATSAEPNVKAEAPAGDHDRQLIGPGRPEEGGDTGTVRHWSKPAKPLRAQQGQRSSSHQGQLWTTTATGQHRAQGPADLALLHPVYCWRVAANQPVLKQLQAGAGPVWAQQLLAGPGAPHTCIVTPEGLILDAVPHASSSRRHGPVADPNSTVGLSSSLLGPGAPGHGIALLQNPQDQQVGLLVLGPADFGPTAVELVLKAGAGVGLAGSDAGAADGQQRAPSIATTGSGVKLLPAGGLTQAAAEAATTRAPGWVVQQQRVAAVLSQHVGVRQSPSHLPHKLKMLLRTETVMLIKGLKKAGWQVLLLPFWEV